MAGTGATLAFHACTYLFNSAIVFPNDGGPAAPHQVAIVLQGAGSQRSGESGSYPGPATTLDIRTADANGHIQTYGLGSLTIRDMTITDGGASNGNPFLLTTNTTINVRHNLFLGNASFGGTTNDQDAIILGGTTNVISGGPTSPFQGYGSVISENQFDRIRRLAYCRVFCNGLVIEKNWIERASGNPLTNGALIEIDGSGAGGVPGNYAVGTSIRDNVVEISNYKYFAYIDYGEYTSVTGNSLFDPTATTLGGVFMTANALDTYIEASLLTGKTYWAGTTSGCTCISQASDGTPSLFPAGVGPLTVNGVFQVNSQTAQLGVAGQTNNLQLLQTSGVAKFSTDGVDVIFSNTASGGMFFDNSGSGGKFIYRTTGFATVLDYGNTAAGAWTFKGQIASNAGLPTIASGACGATTNGAVVAGSTNQSGGITIGAAATTTCTLSWSATLGVAPKACVFFPANAAAAATGTTVAWVGAPSTTSVVLNGSALANANYSYVCL